MFIRFIVLTKRGEHIIEAESLDEAQQKADIRFPNWLEIRYQVNQAEPIEEVLS